MIVTEKCVFVYMPRTGGHFILESLGRHFPGAQHIGYHYPQSLVPGKYKHLPVVGFVRNPWDWYVSWYCFSRMQKSGQRPIFDVLSGNGEFDFKRTVRNLVNLGSGEKESAIFREQLMQRLPRERVPARARFYGLTASDIGDMRGAEGGFFSWMFKRMYGGAGNAVIGKTENLKSDLLAMLMDLGVPVTPGMKDSILHTPKLNTSHHYHYSNFYDPESRELIAVKDKFIIDKFGYEFEAVPPVRLSRASLSDIHAFSDTEELGEQDVCFVCTCDDRYIVPSVVALSSVRKYHPRAGFFIAGTPGEESLELLQETGIAYLPIDAIDTFDDVVDIASGNVRWPRLCFWYLNLYRKLSKAGYRFSCHFDGDVICVNPLDIPRLFFAGVHMAGVRRKDRGINSGVLFFNHMAMEQGRFADQVEEYYKKKKVCRHRECAGFCREYSDQDLVNLMVDEGAINFESLHPRYNYLLAYPEALAFQRNARQISSAEECVFLHLLFKPWYDCRHLFPYPLLAFGLEQWRNQAKETIGNAWRSKLSGALKARLRDYMDWLTDEANEIVELSGK